jgi:hypothetical protein
MFFFAQKSTDLNTVIILYCRQCRLVTETSNDWKNTVANFEFVECGIERVLVKYTKQIYIKSADKF